MVQKLLHQQSNQSQELDEIEDPQGIVLAGSEGLIGRHLARYLWARGHTIIALDTRAETMQSGDRLYTFQCDVTDELSLLGVKNLLEDKCINISSLVHLTALDAKLDRLASTVSGPLLGHDFLNEVNFGLFSVGLLFDTFRSLLLLNEDSSMIVVTSDLALRSPDQTLYCSCGERADNPNECGCPLKPASYSAIKFAQYGLVRYLASTFGHLGLRTNAIAPSGVNEGLPEEFSRKLSRRIPSRKNATFQDVSGIINFLISREAQFLNGVIIPIDGGRSA